jgi:hypothetical protein
MTGGIAIDLMLDGKPPFASIVMPTSAGIDLAFRIAEATGIKAPGDG